MNFKSFIFKLGGTEKPPPDGNTKNVQIVVPLKYLSTFWRTLEIPLINCEMDLFLTWSSACVITNSAGPEIFTITDMKIYVPVLTYQLNINWNLLQQLESGIKRIINWNKYQSKVSIERQN